MSGTGCQMEFLKALGVLIGCLPAIKGALAAIWKVLSAISSQFERWLGTRESVIAAREQAIIKKTREEAFSEGHAQGQAESLSECYSQCMAVIIVFVIAFFYYYALEADRNTA
jgi:hypothetical protein